MTDPIYFYAQTDPFAEFSNFAPYGVEMDGLWWRTVEHYFQAMKFEDAPYRARIRQSHKPKDAKGLGMTPRPALARGLGGGERRGHVGCGPCQVRHPSGAA